MSFTVNVGNPKVIAAEGERLKQIKEMATVVGVEPYEWARPYCDRIIDPQHGQTTYVEGFSASTYAQMMIQKLGPVPHDVNVEIGKPDLDAFTATALLLPTHHDIHYYLTEYSLVKDGIDQINPMETVPDGNLEIAQNTWLIFL